MSLLAAGRRRVLLVERRRGRGERRLVAATRARLPFIYSRRLGEDRSADVYPDKCSLACAAVGIANGASRGSGFGRAIPPENPRRARLLFSFVFSLFCSFCFFPFFCFFFYSPSPSGLRQRRARTPRERKLWATRLPSSDKRSREVCRNVGSRARVPPISLLASFLFFPFSSFFFLFLSLFCFCRDNLAVARASTSNATDDRSSRSRVARPRLEMAFPFPCARDASGSRETSYRRNNAFSLAKSQRRKFQKRKFTEEQSVLRSKFETAPLAFSVIVFLLSFSVFLFLKFVTPHFVQDQRGFFLLLLLNQFRGGVSLKRKT